MAIREMLRERPKVAVGVIVPLLLAVAAYLYLSNGVAGSAASDEAFYTTDDGKTFFKDDAGKLAPFEKDGRQAVLAHVFEANGTRFVNHLERWTPEGRRLMEEDAKAASEGRPPNRSPRPPTFVAKEVKRPGDATWVPENDKRKAGPILMVKPPGGAGGAAVPVLP